MSSPVRFLTRRALLLAASVVLLPFPTAQAEQGAVAEISPPEARTRTSTGEMMLIDVRTPEEWRETGVAPGVTRIDRKSTRLNSSHIQKSRMPSSA